MSYYKYVTVLESQQADPTNDHEEGKLSIKPGKHPDGDSYDILSPDDEFLTIDQDAAKVIELPQRMDKKAAIEYVRRNFEKEEIVA